MAGMAAALAIDRVASFHLAPRAVKA